jgi:hypothetical protein
LAIFILSFDTGRITQSQTTACCDRETTTGGILMAKAYLAGDGSGEKKTGSTLSALSGAVEPVSLLPALAAV